MGLAVVQSISMGRTWFPSDIGHHEKMPASYDARVVLQEKDRTTDGQL